MTLQKSADAVIIGGGIIGAAVAFYLAREKFGEIVLLEKEKFLGSGSTSKAAGGIRAQFTTRGNIEMSMYSEKVFAGFREETGQEALFDQVGYMFLLSRDEDIAVFQKSYELQKSLGLAVVELKPDEIPEFAPHVLLDDIRKAFFCKDDGLGDPNEFLTGYEKAARKLGVKINLDTEVTGFSLADNKIVGVKTSQGDISTPLVINCTGAWSKKIGEMLGIDIKVEPYRRQCVTTGELDFVKPFFPMVVDVESGLYTHKESKGLLLGWADKDVKPSFDISIDPDYTDNILEKALNRIPQLETAEVANQWAGLYETTPDHRAIIGFDGHIDGLFHVTGFSGHGFMHAPAAGVVTAEAITGKTLSLDIDEFKPSRFAEGSVVEETNVI